MAEGIIMKESDVIMQRRDHSAEFGTLMLTQDSLVFERKPAIFAQKEIVASIPLAQIISTNATKQPTALGKTLGTIGILPQGPRILKVVISEAGYELEYFFVVKKPSEWAAKTREAKNALQSPEGT